MNEIIELNDPIQQKINQNLNNNIKISILNNIKISKLQNQKANQETIRENKWKITTI